MFDSLARTANQAVDSAFWYCVDFMVNLAGVTHSSYVEANTWILLLLLPALFALLMSIRLVQHLQLRTLKKAGERHQKRVSEA